MKKLNFNILKLRNMSNLLKNTDIAFDIKLDSKTGETQLILGGEYETSTVHLSGIGSTN